MKLFLVNVAVHLHALHIDSGLPQGVLALSCAADAVRHLGVVADDPLEDKTLLQLQVLRHFEPVCKLLALELLDEGEVFFCLGLVGLFALLCLGFSVGLHGFK